jgi:hypothetical protein
MKLRELDPAGAIGWVCSVIRNSSVRMTRLSFLLCTRKRTPVKKIRNPDWQSNKTLLSYQREDGSPETISDRGSLLTQAVSFLR